MEEKIKREEKYREIVMDTNREREYESSER